MSNFSQESKVTEQHLSPAPTLAKLGKKLYLKRVRNFYILAILASLSLLATLYFDFHHKNEFRALQETQLQWSNRYADASQLLKLAVEVYESRDEIFKSRGSVPAAEKLRPTAAAFYTKLTALQENLHLESTQFYDSRLIPRLESIRTSMHELEIMIETLNAHYRRAPSGITFEEQISLKNKYLEIQAGLYLLQENISLIQYDLLGDKYKSNISLILIELLLKLQAFLMIAGSIYFGRKITRKTNLDALTAQRSAEEFAALYDISMILSQQNDLPSLLKAITQQAKMLLSGSDAVIFLFDESRGDLEVAVSGSMPLGSRLRLGEGIAGMIAQTQEPLIVNDYSSWSHPTERYQRLDVKAVVGVPMLYRGHLLGVLGVDVANDNLRMFTDADARLLSLFAGQAASAVRHAALLEKSRESEERFRIAAACTSDLIYDWDLANDHVEYFGTLPEAIRISDVRLPETQQELKNGICAEDKARVLAARESHFLTNKPYDEEYRITRCDGTKMYVADRAQAIRDKDGRPIRLIGAYKDISERKHNEQMKTNFVSFVAHQLRTPLTGVKWMLNLAMEDSENPEEIQSYIQDALTSTERLIQLVNSMLDIARLERGDMQVARSEVDLPKLTKSVLLEMSSMILEKKLRLSFQDADDAPKPYADPQLLRQVILNLASNAAKYTPSGGEISIRICRNEDQVCWEIKDSGMGIPKFDQQKLFQKFYRAENARAVETEGTGLGLYFVRQIVERHGGRIEYESEEGVGSTFRFSIPIVSKLTRAEMDSSAAEHVA
jgi:nitrogen-specific signal transduction histidine kinase/putative methionine-R-sulfoxide reductase with GAF domain